LAGFRKTAEVVNEIFLSAFIRRDPDCAVGHCSCHYRSCSLAARPDQHAASGLVHLVAGIRLLCSGQR
jgi:hypothetical protein